MGLLSANLLYQFWLHVTWIPRLGPLEGILNTPSAHRVHHACNPRYLDANFGGMVLVFDRMFGTYVAERADEPCRYGLVHPLPSGHVLDVEFRTALDLLGDLGRALRRQDARAFVAHLFAPPEWTVPVMPGSPSMIAVDTAPGRRGPGDHPAVQALTR